MPYLNNRTSVTQDGKSAKIALYVFFNIRDVWNLGLEEQKALLGQPEKAIFYNWKKGEFTNLSSDALLHISNIIGIYKTLGVLFSSKEQAHKWILKPNHIFDGESALSFILQDSLSHLSQVRKYLDAQIY